MPAEPTELDDDQLEALLREAMMTATRSRQADVWLATVSAERVVDVLRRWGVRVLRGVEGA